MNTPTSCDAQERHLKACGICGVEFTTSFEEVNICRDCSLPMIQFNKVDLRRLEELTNNKHQSAVALAFHLDEKHATRMIPAPSGVTVLEALEGEIDETPLIAWAGTADAEAEWYPVTPFGQVIGDYTIQMPSGRCYASNRGMLDRDAAVKHLLEGGAQ
ncbi:hypothetical protein [Shimia gijangensis]|nr:hypothetical protein [Shimia gijangensis]